MSFLPLTSSSLSPLRQLGPTYPLTVRWGPLVSCGRPPERICGTQLSERGGKRGTSQRGRKDISRDPADCAPTCHASVACHVSQSGKNVGAAAIGVLNI